MANCRFDIPTYNDLDCEFESGRVLAIAFVDEDKADAASTSDWSSASFWNTENYTSDILIHNKTTGTYTPSAVKVPGKGNKGERLAGQDHVCQVRLESMDNAAYWNALNKSDNYRLVMVTDDYNKILVVSVNVDIYGRLDIQEDTNSVIDWVVDITWKDFDNPITYDAPAGIFN